MSRPQFAKIVYLASFFVGLQSALAAYVNSSYLKTFLPESLIGILYAAGSLIALGLIALAPIAIRKYGNRNILLLILAVCFFALQMLARGGSAPALTIAFICYMAMNMVAYFAFDIFVEHISIDETTVGHSRGLYLTMVNLAYVFAPLIAGFIISIFGFPLLYGLSMICTFIAILLIGSKMKRYKDPRYRRVSFKKGLFALAKNPNLRGIASIEFLLQFFYAWMTIFMPLYLNSVLGFSWGQIGIMFTIMLVPFVIIEYPLARVADTKLGEKQFLIVGLILTACSCLLVPFMQTASVIAWAMLLFFSRVGAATIESMTEVYFFRHVGGERDSNNLRAFRLVAPVAYIIGPIVGGIILLVSNFETMFAVLGITLLFGLFYAVSLEDKH